MNRERYDTAGFRVGMTAFVLGVLVLFGPLRAGGQTARWVKVPTFRAATGSGIAAEIFARLPNNQPMYGAIRDISPMSNVHESCHRLHAWIRSQHGRPNGLDNASYMPGGWAFIAPEPTRFTFRDVVARTRSPLPSGTAGAVSYWNRQPLFFLDEYSCYACGAIYGIEAGHPQSRDTRDSFRFAGELLAHVRTVGTLARERGYPHTAELAGYVQRVEQLHRQIASHMSSASGSRINKGFPLSQPGESAVALLVTTESWQGFRPLMEVTKPFRGISSLHRPVQSMHKGSMVTLLLPLSGRENRARLLLTLMTDKIACRSQSGKYDRLTASRMGER